MIRVYHNPKSNFMQANRSNPLHSGHFFGFILVHTNDLEEAYMLTNHIDTPWHKNPKVTCIRESRSTSVGDFMERDGEWFVVAPMGFEKC